MDDRDDLAELVAAVEAAGSIRAASRDLSIPRTTLQRRMARAAQLGLISNPQLPAAAVPPEGFAIKSNSAQFDADGNLQKQWVKTTRDVGEEYAIPAGHVVKGESAFVDADGRVMARWIKTKEGPNVGDMIAAIERAFEKYDGLVPLIPAPEKSLSDMLTVYPVSDLHFGMYSWKPETGSDYDTEIAAKMASDAIAALVDQARPSETAVVLVLGDYFHQNDQTNETPAHRHRLDVDGRWEQVYERGADLLVKIVTLVATKHQNVIVKILPGNHDEDAARTLKTAIRYAFAHTDRIKVDRKPGTSWHYQHGKCLIGAHHGHQMKPEVMAMSLAVDCPKPWGESEFRYFYSGHIHHQTAKEIMGVRVESFASPAARDFHAASHGYRSMRNFVAITLHKDRGEIGRITEYVG